MELREQFVPAAMRPGMAFAWLHRFGEGSLSALGDRFRQLRPVRTPEIRRSAGTQKALQLCESLLSNDSIVTPACQFDQIDDLSRYFQNNALYESRGFDVLPLVVLLMVRAKHQILFYSHCC
jgi:hypothetical protein